MGILVAAIKENGYQIEVVSNDGIKLLNILSKYENSEVILLKDIDPYGDTVFNYLQIPRSLVLQIESEESAN